MKLTIDTDKQTLLVSEKNHKKDVPLYTKEAFEIISDLWLKVGWNQKYPYTFSWFGRPVIQLPEDMIRIQEVIYDLKPDVLIETGIAHGGSLIFYASLFKAMNHGRVVGVDIEIRPHNREAMEKHELIELITMIEADAIAESTLNRVKKLIKPDEKVMVVLDSCHTREHVLKELELYSPLVTKGSYIVATDGIMELVSDVPRAGKNWTVDNPAVAAQEFVASHMDFVLETPSWAFNESELNKNITHWPSSWIKRIK